MEIGDLLFTLDNQKVKVITYYTKYETMSVVLKNK